jgi:hypothetical protein
MPGVFVESIPMLTPYHPPLVTGGLVSEQQFHNQH